MSRTNVKREPFLHLLRPPEHLYSSPRGTACVNKNAAIFFFQPGQYPANCPVPSLGQLHVWVRQEAVQGETQRVVISGMHYPPH